MHHIHLASETDFEGWRAAARRLRAHGVAPQDTAWSVGGDLFEAAPSAPEGTFSVPRQFVELASKVIRHTSPDRFDLLYRLLWRLGDAPALLMNRHDAEVARAFAMAAEVDGRNQRGGLAIPSEMANAPISARALKAAQRASRDSPYEQIAATSLDDVAAGVDACRRCELWRGATQGVPGEGPSRASLMLVGEQPGDQEDLAGRPFVGPAGAVLDRALTEAGIARDRVFVTNAVKHFKHELRGKRRLHKTPSASEVEACRWWLEAERRLVRPKVIVALGATAALGVFGRPTTIAGNRGRAHPVAGQTLALVSYHPSFILRAPEESAKAEAFAALVEDLKLAWRLASSAA